MESEEEREREEWPSDHVMLAGDGGGYYGMNEGPGGCTGDNDSGVAVKVIRK